MRVGVIPFRLKKGRFQICIVSSLSKPGQMTLPKGNTKSGEGWEKAALRELFEEAGCKGVILMRRTPLLVSPRRRPQESCIFFWCEVRKSHKSWPEKDQRRRIWHDVGAAMDFSLTRNASKVYAELLDLGLDQDNVVDFSEHWLKQRLEDSDTGRRHIA